jgi:hypothetical protein
MNQLKKSPLFYLSVALVGVVSLQFYSLASAQWSAPTGAPPAGNVAAPLDTGSEQQVKAGRLYITSDDLSTVTNGGGLNGDTGGLILAPGLGAVPPAFVLDRGHVGGYAKMSINPLTGQLSIYNSDSDIILDPHGHNVGIGTASPAVNLEVDGRALITTNASFKNNVNPLSVGGTKAAPAKNGSAENGIARFYTTAPVGYVIDIGINDNYGWIQARSKDSYANNYNLALNPNGGNVGIGTIAPRATFVVSGPAPTGKAGGTGSVGEIAEIFDSSADATKVTYGGLALASGPGSDFMIGKKTDGPAGKQYFQIRLQDGSALMTIDTAGKVGVTSLAGSGDRCVYADKDGVLGVKSVDCGTGSVTVDSNIMTNRSAVAEASMNTATGNGYYTVNKTGYSSGLLVFNAGGSTGPFQLDANYSGLLRWRNETDSDGTKWTPWKSIFSDGGSAVSPNYISKFTSGQALGNSSIYDNGNVGIGTTLPSSQLHISGAAGVGAPIIGGGALYLQDTGGSVNNGGSLLFGAGQGYWAGIKGLIQNGSSNTRGDLAFYTRDQITDANLTERMRITYGGSVGIGTTDPGAYKLNVQGNIFGTGLKVASIGVDDLTIGNQMYIDGSHIVLKPGVAGTSQGRKPGETAWRDWSDDLNWDDVSTQADTCGDGPVLNYSCTGLNTNHCFDRADKTTIIGSTVKTTSVVRELNCVAENGNYAIKNNTSNNLVFTNGIGQDKFTMGQDGTITVAGNLTVDGLTSNSGSRGTIVNSLSVSGDAAVTGNIDAASISFNNGRRSGVQIKEGNNTADVEVQANDFGCSIDRDTLCAMFCPMAGRGALGHYISARGGGACGIYTCQCKTLTY